jgi:hypothetical protein
MGSHHSFGQMQFYSTLTDDVSRLRTLLRKFCTGLSVGTSARKARRKREPSALKSSTSLTDWMSWMVSPALTAINDWGITPRKVPMKKT